MTSKALLKQAQRSYMNMILLGEEAIEESARRIVQMSPVESYDQGMGSWSFSLNVQSYKNTVLLDSRSPVSTYHLSEVERIIDNHDKFRFADVDWREQNPPPPEKDFQALLKVRNAIIEHGKLIEELDSLLSGSFLGSPLSLNHDGKRRKV